MPVPTSEPISAAGRHREAPADLAICRAVTTRVQQPDLPVVAEGVENGRRHEALRSVGYPCGQGIFPDAPLPPERLAGRREVRRAV